MTLTPGSRFGAYEIVDAIGSGGMGEVYRARDTRLDRLVALKVLPHALTRDAARLSRFEREAKVLASLNHPSIATIHGIEDSEGLRALVLELVEGGTLAERVVGPRGAGRGLSTDDIVAIARQIADALDAAHERGIVHRDLKPSNVGLTRTGMVKVLDFGIAKTTAIDVESAHGDGYTGATMTVTEAGVVMGTAAYMSPEQARGQSVDKRTDIWAFGCVLFEMLTHARPFSGKTASDSIAAILEREPDWSALPRDLAPNLRRLLERCLQKDVRRRLRDIGDAHDYFVPVSMPAAVPSPSPRGRTVEFQRLTDEVGINESPAISPDGKMVAFVAVADGRRQIWIRLLNGGAPLQVTRDDYDHLQPRWTPDSSALIYYVPPDSPGDEGALWEVSALGGLPRPITSALGGGDISHDGRRIALLRVHEGRVALVTIARDGSDPRPVASVPRGHVWRSPRWSRDDQWLAFQGRGLTVWDEVLWIAPARGGETRRLARAPFMRGVCWLTDGSGLVYSSSAGSSLPYPPTFNLRVVSADGEVDSQITSGDVSYADPDLHESGRLAVCRVRSESDIWKYPVGGSPLENTTNAERVTRQTGQVQTPSVSPDGSEVVYLSDNGGHANLWIARTDGTRTRQITFERDPSVMIGVPRWSPAGNAIVYIVSKEHPQVWVIRPDGRGARMLVDRGVFAYWSVDGRWLYYTPNVEGENYCIEKMPTAGGTPIVVKDDKNSNAPIVGRDVLYFCSFIAPDFGSWDLEIRRSSPETAPSELLGRIEGTRLPVSPQYVHQALSNDGEWLAFGLTDGGTSNLWVLSTKDRSWRQVTDFGDQPTVIARQVSWSPDGRHLYAAICKTNTDIVMLDGLV
ncbi:MAG TPA: LpqB family beta-propeller domain-containing protein [Vicinamibacterales bacterium]